MRIIDEQYLYEMANVCKADTGLPYDIWIDDLGDKRCLQHDLPRIKVDVNGSLVPVIIDEVEPYIPKDCKSQNFRGRSKVFDYVRFYSDPLLAQWKGIITRRWLENRLHHLPKRLERMTVANDALCLNVSKRFGYRVYLYVSKRRTSQSRATITVLFNGVVAEIRLFDDCYIVSCSKNYTSSDFWNLSKISDFCREFSSFFYAYMCGKLSASELRKYVLGVE